MAGWKIPAIISVTAAKVADPFLKRETGYCMSMPTARTDTAKAFTGGVYSLNAKVHSEPPVGIFCEA